METQACKSCSALLAFLSISVKNLSEFLKEIIEAIYHFFSALSSTPFLSSLTSKISIEDLFPITSNTLLFLGLHLLTTLNLDTISSSLSYLVPIYHTRLLPSHLLPTSNKMSSNILFFFFFSVQVWCLNVNLLKLSYSQTKAMIPTGTMKGTQELEKKKKSSCYLLPSFYNHTKLFTWKWCEN